MSVLLAYCCLLKVCPSPRQKINLCARLIIFWDESKLVVVLYEAWLAVWVWNYCIMCILKCRSHFFGTSKICKYIYIFQTSDHPWRNLHNMIMSITNEWVSKLPLNIFCWTEESETAKTRKKRSFCKICSTEECVLPHPIVCCIDYHFIVQICNNMSHCSHV